MIKREKEGEGGRERERERKREEDKEKRNRLKMEVGFLFFGKTKKVTFFKKQYTIYKLNFVYLLFM